MIRLQGSQRARAAVFMRFENLQDRFDECGVRASRLAASQLWRGGISFAPASMASRPQLPRTRERRLVPEERNRTLDLPYQGCATLRYSRRSGGKRAWRPGAEL